MLPAKPRCGETVSSRGLHAPRFTLGSFFCLFICLQAVRGRTNDLRVLRGIGEISGALLVAYPRSSNTLGTQR